MKFILFSCSMYMFNSMHVILCIHSMHSSLCILFYEFYSMHFGLCFHSMPLIPSYAFYSMNFVLCNSFYSVVLCAWMVRGNHAGKIVQFPGNSFVLLACMFYRRCLFYAFEYTLNSMNFILYISFYAFHSIYFILCVVSYAFNSINFILCISLHAILPMHCLPQDCLFLF